jgi:hypothetical protein
MENLRQNDISEWGKRFLARLHDAGDELSLFAGRALLSSASR